MTLPLVSTLVVAKACRDTLLAGCPGPIPEWLSGHSPDGTPSQHDHLAVIPLAHVGRAEADGHLLGIALVLPTEVTGDEQARCLGPLLYDSIGLPRRITLRMGRVGVMDLVLEEREQRPLALRPETWTAASAQGARRWASVTPIALDRFPKGKDRWAAMEATVARSAARIGVGEPREVIVAPVAIWPGVPRADQFPALIPRHDRGRIFHTHAVVAFEEPVCGPLLLGAGRYRGYGLMRPLDEESQ